MKSWIYLSPLLLATSASAAKLSHNLFGDWREGCLKNLDLGTQVEGAPFVQFKMVIGWNGSMEYNYSYFSDDQCTKRKSQRREFASYTVLESANRRAKLLVRKDLGGGMISESVIEVSLDNINHLASKTLKTNIEFDDLLSTKDPLEGVDKDSGSGEALKNLSRHVDDEKAKI